MFHRRFESGSFGLPFRVDLLHSRFAFRYFFPGICNFCLRAFSLVPDEIWPSLFVEVALCSQIELRLVLLIDVFV